MNPEFRRFRLTAEDYLNTFYTSTKGNLRLGVVGVSAVGLGIISGCNPTETIVLHESKKPIIAHSGDLQNQDSIVSPDIAHVPYFERIYPEGNLTGEALYIQDHFKSWKDYVESSGGRVRMLDTGGSNLVVQAPEGVRVRSTPIDHLTKDTGTLIPPLSHYGKSGLDYPYQYRLEAIQKAADLNSWELSQWAVIIYRYRLAEERGRKDVPIGFTLSLDEPRNIGAAAMRFQGEQLITDTDPLVEEHIRQIPWEILPHP